MLSLLLRRLLLRLPRPLTRDLVHGVRGAVGLVYLAEVAIQRVVASGYVLRLVSRLLRAKGQQRGCRRLLRAPGDWRERATTGAGGRRDIPFALLAPGRLFLVRHVLEVDDVGPRRRGTFGY